MRLIKMMVQFRMILRSGFTQNTVTALVITFMLVDGAELFSAFSHEVIARMLTKEKELTEKSTLNFDRKH